MSVDRHVSSSRAARRAAGYSMEQVSALSGRSVPTVRAFELNERGVSDEVRNDLTPVYEGFRRQAETVLLRQ